MKGGKQSINALIVLGCGLGWGKDQHGGGMQLRNLLLVDPAKKRHRKLLGLWKLFLPWGGFTPISVA